MRWLLIMFVLLKRKFILRGWSLKKLDEFIVFMMKFLFLVLLGGCCFFLFVLVVVKLGIGWFWEYILGFFEGMLEFLIVRVFFGGDGDVCVVLMGLLMWKGGFCFWFRCLLDSDVDVLFKDVVVYWLRCWWWWSRFL